jgi:metal-dependent amidase/aminoacylase/carboxypeptidase family protein
MTETVRESIQQNLEHMVTNTAKAYGCEAAFEYERGPSPVINDAGTCEQAASVARELALNVEVNPPSMIAEDFSRYLQIAPGALFRIGTGGGFDNHHPSFTADPSALLPAARFFATLAERELQFISSKGKKKT